MIVLAVGVALGTVVPSQAQKSNESQDEVKKLQQQIEKIQAAIKAAEAKIKEAEQARPRDADRKPETPPGDRTGRGFGPGGGIGSFGPGPGGGRGMGGMMAGGMGPGFGRFDGGNDVKSLENQLTQLRSMSKRIDERIKDVEVQLKKAKEEEAKKERSHSADTAKQVPSASRTREGRSAADVEKRLDRIEAILDEIQKELKRRRSDR
jgi:septal ring factor EnvC (AmiA/AmiB activator)